MSHLPSLMSADVLAEAVLPVDGGHTGVRFHDDRETVVSVLEGVVYLVAADDEVVLTPGDTATVPAGVAHRYWNAGDEPARLVERRRAAAPPPCPEALRRAA
jgi:mannose-6-phosphate isomerase-like protein (cupin superfamily)